MKRLQQYQDLLATDGVQWGLIGPREAGRLWDRHIDNCLAVTEDSVCLPEAATVLDVGSGAGLPGLVWAIARPDLQVTLVEPLERRVRFLEKVATELDVPVQIVRGRIQDVDASADRVTARAVATTSKLLEWLAPHTAGRMILLKGERAQQELVDAQPWLATHGWRGEVRMVGIPARTRVIDVWREDHR